jgi:hypothetical protein
MAAVAEPTPVDVIAGAGRPVLVAPSRAPGLAAKLMAFPVKFLWGMAFCQGLLGSLLVAGWACRLAQRSALKYWWSRSGRTLEEASFLDFLAANERTRPHRHWPNWFFEQNLRQTLRRMPGSSLGSYLLALLSAPVNSLWRNFWLGLQVVANTWLLTLPACLFWWFGWYDGWNNSFNKGYEQAAVGPLVSVFGILLFIVAMFYVPLAQARQAVTGQWRAFFQFRLVWRIVRSFGRSVGRRSRPLGQRRPSKPWTVTFFGARFWCCRHS